jgi:hypothetical protein
MPDQFHATEVWAIHYEDADRQPEIFVGEGAEEAARKTFEQRNVSWNCYLLSTAHVFNDEPLRNLLRDAERWRALTGCQRLHVLGSAGFDGKHGDYRHLGIDAWTEFPFDADIKRQSEAAAAQLTEFADVARMIRPPRVRKPLAVE